MAKEKSEPIDAVTLVSGRGTVITVPADAAANCAAFGFRPEADTKPAKAAAKPAAKAKK